MTGKYTPLENYLHNLPADQREITLSFEQIERILNDKLPRSAYEYLAWWASEKEGNHVNARAWANAGWKVKSVDFNRNEQGWFVYNSEGLRSTSGTVADARGIAPVFGADVATVRAAIIGRGVQGRVVKWQIMNILRF